MTHFNTNTQFSAGEEIDQNCLFVDRIRRGTKSHHPGHPTNYFLTETTVEIYSKTVIGVIGKVLLMKIGHDLNENP